MKRTISVTFNEPEKESTLMLNYYESIRKNTPMPGSGWSIDGTYSTDASPQPTPQSSPRAKNKSMRVDNGLDGTIKQFSKLLLNEASNEQHSSFTAFEFSFQSMTSMPPSTLSRSSTLLSFKSSKSTPNASAEELTIGHSAKSQKSKPMPIRKKKGFCRKF